MSSATHGPSATSSATIASSATTDPSVTIGVVCWNSATVIEPCLASIRAQTHPRTSLLVADNASADDTRARLERLTRPDERIYFNRNLGFSAAHNALIRRGADGPPGLSDYYLALNPDIELTPSFVATLVAALDAHPRAGAATGKLLRFPSAAGDSVSGGLGGGAGEARTIVDSTGIVMQPSQRHLDRGSDEVDRGQFERLEYVFGASGAAALYRRRMLDDIAVDGEWFDEDFFAYREDADLAWRAQLLGWDCLYVPHAVARHGRRVTPERREALPPEINRYSVRNRFLLRLKNQTAGHALAFAGPALLRDLQVVGFVLAKEHSSIGGLIDVVRLLPRMWTKRRAIMARRRRPTRDIVQWFRRASLPAD